MDNRIFSLQSYHYMLIIQGALAWDTPPVELGCETKIILKRIDGNIFTQFLSS